jgi:hypothetical protein
VTVAPVIGVTTEQKVTPYISPAMFRNDSRRGVDLASLVPNGPAIEQDAALARYIRQATAVMDSFLLQSLAATIDTEFGEVHTDRSGRIKLQTRFRPVIALTAFSIGADPSQMTAMSSLAGTAVMPDRIIVTPGAVGWMTNQGPLQFGAIAPMRDAYASWSYCNGYPVTWLTAGAAAAATQIAVADTTGIIAGQTQLSIQSGVHPFTFVAGAVSTASGGLGTGPGTVVCPALPYAVTTSIDYPTYVTALPDDVIYGCVLATRALIKKTSSGNISSQTNNSGRDKDPLGAGDDMAMMYELIDSYQVPQT